MDHVLALFVSAVFFGGWGLLFYDIVCELDWLGRAIAFLLGALAVIAVILVAYGKDS